MDCEIRVHDDVQIYAIWGPVLLRITDGGTTTPEDIDFQHGIVGEMLERWPSIGFLVVAHHGNPVPTVGTMRYATKRFASFESRLVVGMTLLGIGHWVVASNAAIAFMRRLVRANTFILGNSIEQVVDGMALELIGLDGEALVGVAKELQVRLRPG